MIIRMQTALAVLVAMGHLVVLAMSATARDAGKLSDPFLDVKRPADQDTYDAYVSGKKSLVTSFQVTPVIATNAECIEKGKNCEWREVGIHERASGFVMLRNNANFKDPSHNFAFSCIICGTDALCSDPDDHAMRATVNKNMKDGTVGHHLRLNNMVKKATAKCKNSMPERKLSMKHLRTIHQGLSSLMGMPEGSGAGLEGSNVGASDLLDDPNFGSPDGDLATVQGTNFLSPSRMNSVQEGKDVNNGNVKNTVPYVKASVLREKLVPATDAGKEKKAEPVATKKSTVPDLDDNEKTTGLKLMTRAGHSRWLKEYPIKEMGASEKLAVRCCSDTEPRVTNRTYGCNNGKTYQEAVAICKKNSYRLCTLEEVNKGRTDNAGCGFNAKRIWTSTVAGTSKPAPTKVRRHRKLVRE